jgi:hypothetical protein
MQALLLCGLAVYYAAVAAGLSWWLKGNSPRFTGFLAIVVAQAVLYGGDYLYRGYFETLHYITVMITTAWCIAVVAVVVGLIYGRRSSSGNAPT